MVMKHFFAEHPTIELKKEHTLESNLSEDIKEDIKEDIQCEEALMEAFGK